MAQNAVAGNQSYANWGFESSYGAGAVSARVFGHGTKITVTRRNSMERVYGIGARNATANVAKKYEGSASVEFVMSNGSFFRALLGTVTDGGSAPYTHTYTEANVLPSFSIDTGTELGTNDEVTELKGCYVGSATITAAVDELVKVKLECPYKTETLATSGIGSQVAETESPFTFAQGTLSIGGTINYVQSVDLTVNNSLEGIWGIGSRLKQAEPAKIREYNVKMSVAFNDVSALLTKFFGASANPLDGNPAAQATLVLTFTNGLTGSDQRSVVLTFANFYIDEHTLPKDVNEIIKEDVSGWALSCTSVVYSNNTASDDDTP